MSSSWIRTNYTTRVSAIKWASLCCVLSSYKYEERFCGAWQLSHKAQFHQLQEGTDFTTIELSMRCSLSHKGFPLGHGQKDKQVRIWIHRNTPPDFPGCPWFMGRPATHLYKLPPLGSSKRLLHTWHILPWTSVCLPQRRTPVLPLADPLEATGGGR